MAFRRCSCVALLVFYMIIALTWSNSLVGADTITTELPLQACPNIMRQVQGDNILMYLNGSRGSFHAPPSPGKPFDMESSLYFQWTDVREVGRTGVRCSNSLDVPINILPLYECDCAITVVSTVANGVKKTGWEMTISGCPAPQQNLVAKAQVTTTNVTTVEIFNKTMPHSTADAFNYTSTAGAIKFGFDIRGWNWNTTANANYLNNTYLGVGIQFGFASPRNLTITQSRTPLDYYVGTYFGSTLMQIKMDLGYVLEGNPVVNILDKTEVPLKFENGTSLIAINTPFPFCQPTVDEHTVLDKWDHIYYDPSIQVIFGDLDSPSTPLTPREKSNKKAVAIAVPIVVVLLVAFAAALIILTIVSPTVHDFFMPYNKRKVVQSRTTESDTWKRSTTPNL